MSNTYRQLPSTLNLCFRRSDQFGTQVDFDVSISGSTVTSQIVSAVSGAVVAPITTTIDDAAAGKVSIALTELETSSIPCGTYNWIMVVNQPGDVQRTFLAGVVEVRP